MTSLRIVSVLAALSLLAGCPASTTLSGDAGGLDAPAADTGGGGTDVGPSSDAGPGNDGGEADAFAIDAGPAASWAVCNATSECVLRSAGCCDPCGAPMLSQVDAVNASQVDAHFMAVCPAPTPCPRCPTGLNANLVATCAAQRCEALDLATLPLSACTSDSDCVVRYARCCGCSGTPTEVVSIRGDAHGALDALLCDGGSCPTDCAPVADPGFTASCDPATHHCVATPR